MALNGGGAHRQSQRANIRESSGGGGGSGGGGVDDGAANGQIQGQTYCVDLSPTKDEIQKELEKRTITQVKGKEALVKEVIKNRDAVIGKLRSLGQEDLASAFERAVPADWLKGENKKNKLLCVLLVLRCTPSSLSPFVRRALSPLSQRLSVLPSRASRASSRLPIATPLRSVPMTSIRSSSSSRVQIAIASFWWMGTFL